MYVPTLIFYFKTNNGGTDRNSAVSPSLLEGLESIEINDGTGRVIVNLDVFHNLHCLNYVRKYIFRSHYQDTFPPDDKEKQLDHVGHCIDMIRESLVCHADIAISTYSWKKGRLLPFPNFRVDHECRNWEKIMEWAKAHQAPSLRGNALIHPVFGKLF